MSDLLLPALGPGLHADIPAARYHADQLCTAPTLSSSTAKTLLGKTPRHAWRDHPRLNPTFEPSDDGKFDLGSVAHEMILGRGAGFEVVDAAGYQTKAAKAARDDARKAGKTPILVEQHDRAMRMTHAVWDSLTVIPDCEHVLDDRAGQAETVGIWRDIGGPVCRMMIDWMGPAQTDIWDVKTTGAGLSNSALSRLIDNLGYDLSAAFYLRGLRHLLPELGGRFRWRWIFVEDEEPHEVRVVEATPEQIGRGHRKAALAIVKWHACMTTGLWPGYPREITRVEAPGWAEAQWNEREMIDPDFERVVLLDHHPIPRPAPDTIIFGERRFTLPAEAS